MSTGSHVTSPPIAATVWARMFPLPAQERPLAMGEVLAALLTLDDAGRHERISAMIAVENRLESGDLAAMAASRLRALATFGPEHAGELMASWQQAEQEQPASTGMRRAVALQAAAKQLSLEEMSRIEGFLPAVREFGGVPASGLRERLSGGQVGSSEAARPQTSRLTGSSVC